MPHVQTSQLTKSSKTRERTTSQSGGATRGALEGSPFKRQKTEHSSSQETTPQAEQFRPDNMYKFSSKNSSNVIDLTESPSPSSKASPRRPSGIIRPTNFTPRLGARKIEIKNFRSTTRADPDQYFNDTWKRLDEALGSILARDDQPFSREELYRGVENICQQNRAPALYQKLVQKCSDHITSTTKTVVLRDIENASHTDVLKVVVNSWTIWQQQITIVRSIFFYLDRSYLLHSSSQCIEELGISLFRTHIYNNPSLNQSILTGACDLVSCERNDDPNLKMDQDLFRNAISMFHVLVVYTKAFEPVFLAHSQAFFQEWTETNKPPSMSLPEYVSACHELFASEKLRCQIFNLDDTTRRDIQSQVENFLVVSQNALWEDMPSISALLDGPQTESLQKLYTLLQLRDMGKNLRPAFEDYISTEGSSIVFDEKREGEMVIRLLYFKKTLDYIWEYTFAKNQELGHGLREAFEKFMNKTKKTNMTWGTDNDKPGEMIAKYVDMILRGGSRVIPQTLAKNVPTAVAANDEDIENAEVNEEAVINDQLDQVLALFRFVHGKAVFEAFYKKDLAKRLLMGRSASADAEKSMLDRLKTECGANFTHNLEQMFQDIELAREENASYKAFLHESGQKMDVDLNVNVLSASAWPTYPDVKIDIPQNIQATIEKFQRQYKNKHGGRKLEWKHALAHCQMKAEFPKGNKELVVSSFQAIVLLYFNGRSPEDPVSFTELLEAMRVDVEELKRTLQSLACAKYRVLMKTPKGKDVESTDTFTINLNFADPKYRIKINQIQLKETREENKETHERVAADRQFETQAAIVRIMKGRQKVQHNDLMIAVIDATKSRGPVSPEDIKKQIDKLIDKEYMERIADQAGWYEYVA